MPLTRVRGKQQRKAINCNRVYQIHTHILSIINQQKSVKSESKKAKIAKQRTHTQAPKLQRQQKVMATLTSAM